MTKASKIAYWIATVWLSLGMTSTGIVQLLKNKTEIELITKLGYPAYILTLLGVWKLLGVIAILLPKFAVIKEWAYAGFFFAMTGAVYSHIASGYMDKVYGAVLLLVLTIVSWYFRPADRKLAPIN